MDEHTLRDFRERLESHLRGLLDGGSTPSKLSDHGTVDPMDEADLASHHCDQALVHTIGYRTQQLVREIRAAIQRIDEGEFGVCSLCSSSIGLGRLQARPTAMLCIRCQEALESVKRRFSGAQRRGRAA